MNYRIGLDIGIGTVGWSVVSEATFEHEARLEDFGTRVFTSGENSGKKYTLCQERRGFRGVRRIERRRSHRKMLLTNHFRLIGLIGETFNDDLAKIADCDVYEMKVRGIKEKLSPAELYKCLVHTSNHRGYSSFYEISDEDKDEEGVNASAVTAFEKAFNESDAAIVSEYLITECRQNNFVKFRNRAGNNMPHLLIGRNLLKDEAEKLLKWQSQYYHALSPENIKKTIGIIFSQRDFEDGPGDPNDPTRRYHGFLETLGQCQYYKDEKRGFRSTVIADIFAVTNTLSQYRFINTQTGEYELSSDIAEKLVRTTLENAEISISEVKKILKANGYILHTSDNSDSKALSKAIKYLSVAKKCIESAGMDWKEIISEDQFDPDTHSLLHNIGELISKYQTPSRRKKEMQTAGISKELIAAFADKRISGTSSVSDRYMCDAIHAFMNGDIYGNFQSNSIKQHERDEPTEKAITLESRHIDDPEVRENRVVFKAINETRKVVNAIISRYGSPTEIVVEVANELGKSFKMRDETRKHQREAENNNEADKKSIAGILGIDTSDVKNVMIERYRLYNEQDGKSIYSGVSLGNLKDVLLNDRKQYEIDHIVPYSLILDNTLQNKALVFTDENQSKGQRTPLMYITDEEKKKKFISQVNRMSSRKDSSISKKKYGYYMLKTIYSTEAEAILREWKSRNINDTRYITKYIAGLFERHLAFAGDKDQHVFTVKGVVSQKFRREWFKDSKWGQTDKDRSTHLNHALDAVVVANLTKPYIEIGSDTLRLVAIYKHDHGKSAEYMDYLESCVTKMKTYYGFNEEYTRRLLSNTGRVPSYMPNLNAEVEARFIDSNECEFRELTSRVYQNDNEFLAKLKMPVTSYKAERKFKGQIADANPIRIAEIDGRKYKIDRTDIRELTKDKFERLYSTDISLKEQLSEIFGSAASDKYTVGQYLKDNGLDKFVTKGGTVIRKVSVIDKTVSNYYRYETGDDNYTYLGGLKYYCIEIYKDKKGSTKISGLRFVDIVKKNGKLYRKAESLPDDYDQHVMYLFRGDYVKVFDKNDKLKFSGFYMSVKNILRSIGYFAGENNAATFTGSIGSSDSVRKYDVSILGKIGGEIKCSAPLPCTKENESQ